MLTASDGATSLIPALARAWSQQVRAARSRLLISVCAQEQASDVVVLAGMTHEDVHG